MVWLYAGLAVTVVAAVVCGTGWGRAAGHRRQAEQEKQDARRDHTTAQDSAVQQEEAARRFEWQAHSAELAVDWWTARHGELAAAVRATLEAVERASGMRAEPREEPVAPTAPHGAMADARRLEHLVVDVIEESIRRDVRARETQERTVAELSRERAAVRAAALAGVRATAEQMHTALSSAQVAIDQTLERFSSEVEQGVVQELDRCVSQAGHAVQRLRVLSDAWPGVQRADCTVEEIVEGARGRTRHFDLVRWQPGTLGEVWIEGRVAEPIAIALAEFMDNATAYSGRSVSVRAEPLGETGGVRLTVADEGLGMTRGQLDAARAVLAAGQVLDATTLDGGEQFGLLVVGRLAALYGLPVQLDLADGGGVMATLDIGARHLADVDEPAAAGVLPWPGPVAEETVCLLPERGQASTPSGLPQRRPAQLPGRPAAARKPPLSPEATALWEQLLSPEAPTVPEPVAEPVAEPDAMPQPAVEALQDALAELFALDPGHGTNGTNDPNGPSGLNGEEGSATWKQVNGG